MTDLFSLKVNDVKRRVDDKSRMSLTIGTIEWFSLTEWETIAAESGCHNRLKYL